MLRAMWPEPVASPRPAERRIRPTGRRVALVTGANGFIGRHLVARLCAEGLQVRALVRSAARAGAMGPNVEVIAGNLGDPETITGIADGAEMVFHLASIMRGRWEDFEQVDVAGTRLLLDEARHAGTRRIVFTSTMSVYPLGAGRAITEEMIESPERVGPYARAKLTIEQMLMDANRAGQIEAVVTRPGLVFGPGSSPYLTHLPHLGTLRGNRYIVFGDGAVPLQLTFVENTVDALWRAATRPAAAGKTFTLVDPDPPTQREYVRALAELTRRPLELVRIPRSVAWMAGLAAELGSAALHRPPPTTRRLLLGKTAKPVFDCSRARSVLGWNPAVHWREGLRRAVAWALAGGGSYCAAGGAPPPDARRLPPIELAELAER
jgi:nucleoside-diphosphate-sugar epimerase